ncbi:MAG: mechanosensitive ion channel family protein [Bacteroidales bacterium]
MKEYLSEEFWMEAMEVAANWLFTDFPGLIVILIIMVLALRAARVLSQKLRKMLIGRAEKSQDVDSDEAVKRINTLTDIIHKIIVIVLFAVFSMLILQKIGVNIGPLLASVGILGLAIGFGAQELVRDFISGFFIILENQVRTGDVAIIDGQGGLVESIDLRTITLRDFAGTVHIFQNGKISTMANMTKDWSSMVFDIGVAYKENTQLVMDVIKEVGDQLQADPELGTDIIEPIEVFGLDKFGDSAIVIKARIKTKPGKQWSVGREYRKRLKVAFDSRNIEIPFPHTTVYWGEEINPLKLDVSKTPEKLS